MQPPSFSKWASGNTLASHVLLPGLASVVLMAMYFSAIEPLQNIVAPSINGVPLFSTREFGVLEMLQNVVLLCFLYYAARSVLATGYSWVRVLTLSMVLAGVFAFLEEIDYGAHFVEYLSGEYGSLAPETWDRNWHNKVGPSGEQNVTYLKLAANAVMLFGFVLAPLLLSRVRNQAFTLLLPSRWMAATVVLIVLLSLLAHALEDAGFATIGENPGNLHKNISEFRELNVYYLFLLYSAVLYERLLASGRAEGGEERSAPG